MKTAHDDFAALRRYLIEYGFIDRKPDGGQYWLNIAQAQTVQYAEEAFMNSPGHRANILNPQHNTIGIGITNTQSGVVVTQLFAQK